MTARGLPARLLVAAACLFAFWPVLGNGFVNWDDSWYLLDNPHFKGWTLENLRWMFTLWPHGGHYCPLTWLTYAVDWSLWGMDPRGFHFTSLILHAAGALAFYGAGRRILSRAGAARPEAGALFAALLFAIHPLRVESVAWASERRDVLSGLFYMLTISLYMDRRSRAAWACYAACLLSKSMGMTLPAVLVILDAYPLGRLPEDPRRWADRDLHPVWLEKAAFLIPAAVVAVATVGLQTDSGAVWGLGQLGYGWRVGMAFYSVIFYLGKTVFPMGLLPIYPVPPDPAVLLPAMVLAGAGAVAITALAIARRKQNPALLAVWAFYLVSLLPVCGLVKIGPQIAADRYTYLPCLGWALLAGWAASLLGRRSAWAAGLAAILLLGGLTRAQTRVWKDTETLWSAMVSADPNHFIARNFLAQVRAVQGRPQEAEALYREALSIHPGYGAAHNNLAGLLAGTGRPEQALAHYAAAEKASPGHKAVHFNWATALIRLGRQDEAAAHLERELEINPGHEPSRRLLESIRREPKKKR